MVERDGRGEGCEAHRHAHEQVVQGPRAVAFETETVLGGGGAARVVVTENDNRTLFAYASSRETVESVGDVLMDVLSRGGRRGTIAVDHWDDAAGAWQQVRGPASRAEELRERADEPYVNRMSPRALRRARLASLAGAAAGTTWYALTANGGPYLPSILLTMPLLLMSFVWLHRRLPMWLQWSAALTAAALGALGYLVEGNSHWWIWGQVPAVPLVMLVFRGIFREIDSHPDLQYIGPIEGPWGPP